MKRFSIISLIVLTLVLLLSVVPSQPKGQQASGILSEVSDSVAPVACAYTHEECERFRRDCTNVANNAEAMCNAMGGSYIQCHFTDWFNAYFTCLEGTGCPAVSGPSKN